MGHSEHSPEPKKRAVQYITIDDVNSGLFFSQVLRPFCYAAEQDSHRSFELIAINRPWKLLGHIKKLREFRSLGLPENLIIRYLPLLPPLRRASGSVIYSSLVTLYLALIMLAFGSKNAITHARSYWPCAAALKAKLQIVIFEPRSLWTLENIAMGDIREGSSAERYWNRLEARCVLEAKRVVSINSEMAEYFRHLYQSDYKNVVIPISFDEDVFFFNGRDREKIRAELSLTNKKVFVYSGSFGMSHVGLTEVINTVHRLNNSVEDPHFIFLTPPHEDKTVLKVAAEAGLDSDTITSIHPHFDKIKSFLSAADFGFHALPPQPDHFTRMGTKVIEYFATGLPVIVNEYVGAAARIIDETSFGFVLTDEMRSEDIAEGLIKLSQFSREQIAAFAHDKYEVCGASHSYARIYTELDIESSDSMGRW